MTAVKTSLKNEFSFSHTLASLLSCLAGVIILSRFRCRRRNGPLLKLSTDNIVYFPAVCSGRHIFAI